MSRGHHLAELPASCHARHVSAREELAALPLHQRIRALLKRSRLSQEAFAARLGVDRSRANAWANGRSGIGEEYGEKIAILASEVFDEELPAELFSTHRRLSAEEALAAAAERLAATLEDLTGLLREQRQLVDRMSRIATVLERREAATPTDPKSA